MGRPELKQFGDLGPADLARHPVWIACHTADYDEPWYDETDEETFRPREGPLPADPSEGMLLVRATATLNDGTQLPGLLTPGFEGDDLGILQPQVFVGGRMFGFWGGMFAAAAEMRQAFYKAIGKAPEAVFPIDIAADPAECGGVARARVEGFYKSSGKKVEVDR